MNSKHFLKYTSLILQIVICLAASTTFAQPTQSIKEKLTVPFGTLVKMIIEIVDGKELNDKSHQSSFLFRVKSVDSLPLSQPVLIEFKDETGNFPNDNFELYKYLYGKKAGTISAKEIEEMKKKYVGRKFNIVAYETGEFTGIPDGYYKYQPERQDYGFHFRQYVIVVADLLKAVKQ